MAQVGAVLAARIVGHLGIGRREAMTWRAQVGDVLIDNTQGLVHDGTVLAIHMGTEGILEGLLDIKSHIIGIARGQRRGAGALLLLGRGGRREFSRRSNRSIRGARGANMARSLRSGLAAL